MVDKRRSAQIIELGGVSLFLKLGIHCVDILGGLRLRLKYSLKEHIIKLHHFYFTFLFDRFKERWSSILDYNYKFQLQGPQL